MAHSAQKYGQKYGGEYQGQQRWICQYGHHFRRSVAQVKRGKWCPRCGTKGERAIADLLYRWGGFWQKEFRIPTAPDHPLYRKRYDFYVLRQPPTLIEFDGPHHFVYKRKFHRGRGGLQQQQRDDYLKTWLAYDLGYQVIRIDYDQLPNIAYHLNQAWQTAAGVYVSDLTRYAFLRRIEKS